MKKKYIPIYLLILSLLVNVVLAIDLFNKKDNKQSIEISKSEKDELISEWYSIKNVSEDEKEKIARKLFEEYINENSTDWKEVENDKLDREPLPTFTDYKIDNVSLQKEEGNMFTAEVLYDIQYTKNGTQWLACDGELADDNWIKNKGFYIDIARYNDKYVITNMYT